MSVQYQQKSEVIIMTSLYADLYGMSGCKNQ